MIVTALSQPIRCFWTVALLALAAVLAPAGAQQYPPYPGPGPVYPGAQPGYQGPGYSGSAQGPPGSGQAPPASAQRNPVCVRLEAQLATVDRGNADPARAAEIRRYEDMAARQQGELDRFTARARQTGCEGLGFFSLFSGQAAQCGPINNQIQQTRANLDRTLAEIQRLQGSTADREGQRRQLLASLGQNDCGPQYRAYANRGGFFDAIFGPGSIVTPDAPEQPAPSAGGGTYRTICVRTCDGYYFPVSYATVPAKFGDDERVCQRLCPASEAVLYSYRSSGEDISQAVTSAGRTYSELPTAFSYRKAFNPTCTCKAPNQTWADVVKQTDDQTIERGDIVVTPEQARQLSQPTQPQGGGRQQRSGARQTPPSQGAAPAPKATVAPAPTAATPAPADEKSESDPAKRQVRTVGPTFLPTR